MIKVDGLYYTYPHEHHVLEDVTFEANVGEFWGILGANGAGKTTLLDLLIGYKTPSLGNITINGHRPNINNLENEIVFLSQDVCLKGDISIKEFLDFNSFFYRRYSKELELELIEYFSVDEKSLIGALSTGQQKKVQIIAGLAANTKIILIDEITAVLDPDTRFYFFKKLDEIMNSKERLILLATNIAEDIENYAEKVLFIDDTKSSVVKTSEIKRLFKNV